MHDCNFAQRVGGFNISIYISEYHSYIYYGYCVISCLAGGDEDAVDPEIFICTRQAFVCNLDFYPSSVNVYHIYDVQL